MNRNAFEKVPLQELLMQTDPKFQGVPNGPWSDPNDTGMAWEGGKSLKCVELKTGAEKGVTPDFALGTMVLVDDCLVILAYDGKLGLVEARPDAYRKLGEMKVFQMANSDDRAYTAPAVANGKLYLRHLQKLVCFDLK